MADQVQDFEEVFVEVIEVLTERPKAWLEQRAATLAADVHRLNNVIRALNAVGAAGGMSKAEHRRQHARLVQQLQDASAELKCRKAALLALLDQEAGATKAERIAKARAQAEGRQRDVAAAAAALGGTARLTDADLAGLTNETASKMADLLRQLNGLGRRLDALNQERARRGMPEVDPKRMVRDGHA